MLLHNSRRALFWWTAWWTAPCATSLFGCGSGAGAVHTTASPDGGVRQDVGACPASSPAGGSAPGCDEGTSCSMANDLSPPTVGAGFQIATPNVALQPNQESYSCYFETLPGNADMDVGKIQSWMTPGSSHELIANVIEPGARRGPEGQLADCNLMTTMHRIYSASLSGSVVGVEMPDHVGLLMPAGTQVMLMMHLRNPGSTTLAAQAKLNLLFATGVQSRAGTLFGFNTEINVPPAGPDGNPGTQTVEGKCTAPAGSNVFLMTTKTYMHATLAEVSYESGGRSQTIVHSTDWEHPDGRVWQSPCFLTLKSGDAIHYSCTYTNSGATPIVVGESEASNEICMALGYYFPAGSTECF